jgi:galactose mutarotase-like enzyme
MVILPKIIRCSTITCKKCSQIPRNYHSINLKCIVALLFCIFLYFSGMKDNLPFNNSFKSIDLQLENEILSVRFQQKGAELVSMINKKDGAELIWQADPKFWGKHAPVLFPIVGTLANGRLQWNGKSFPLSRHGFARDLPFDLLASSTETLVFRLTSSPETLRMFPFRFIFDIVYTLKGAGLTVTYKIQRPEEQETMEQISIEQNSMKQISSPLFFSVGAHPAFHLPQEENWVFRFPEPVTAARWPINEEGLLRTYSVDCLNQQSELPIVSSIFSQDALVFKNFPVNQISIYSASGKGRVQMSWEGFPYLGLWSAPQSPFVCIEPWCGVADTEGFMGDFSEKEGIQSVQVGEVWERSYTINALL